MSKKNRNNDEKRNRELAPPPDAEASSAPAETGPTRMVKQPTAQSNPFYGCAILLIAIITLGGSAFYMFIYTPYVQDKEISKFTVPDAPPLPTPAVDDAKKSALKEKLSAFGMVASNGKPVTLTLSTDDLNTLLVLAAEYDKATDYRGIVLFTGMDAATQSLKADIRWKLNNLPFVQAPDRFLAGHATFKPVIENNALELHIATLDVPGKTVSEGFIKQLGNWPWLNLAKLKDDVKKPLSKVTRFEFSSDGSLFVLHSGETVSR